MPKSVSPTDLRPYVSTDLRPSVLKFTYFQKESKKMGQFFKLPASLNWDELEEFGQTGEDEFTSSVDSVSDVDEFRDQQPIGGRMFKQFSFQIKLLYDKAKEILRDESNVQAVLKMLGEIGTVENLPEFIEGSGKCLVLATVYTKTMIQGQR